MSDEPEETTPAPEESETGDTAPDTPESEEPKAEVTPADESVSAEESDSGSGGPVAIGKGKLSESDDKTFGMLAHLLGAFTFFVGPLIIWLIKREESPFVDDQGKESVNWQIGVLIAFAVFGVLSSIDLLGCILWPLRVAIPVANLIFCILACVEANKGNAYRYPVNLRLIK